MTQIILVRHGQTPWNQDKIFRGSRDIPLNDQGREEARLAGEWLKGETIHAAYCSPLSRARDTGEAIARHHGLQVVDLPGLTDLCYGDWEGLPLTEVKVKYADLYRQWETAPAHRPFPRGRDPGRSQSPGPGRGGGGGAPPPRPDGPIGGPPGGEQGAHRGLHRSGQLPLLAPRPGHHGHQPLRPG